MNPSKTPSTEARYTTIAERLLRRFAHDSGMLWKENETSFFEWLLAYRDGLRPSAWRQYRAALAWFMENHPEGEPSMAASIRAIPNADHAIRTSIQRHARSSSSKPKRLPKEVLQELENYIYSETRSPHYRVALAWLRATLLTGLRPIEWQGAQILEEGPNHLVLHVKNAKNTNGRTFGNTRTILLKPLSEQDILDIQAMVTLGQQPNFEYIKERTAIYLRRANQALWGNLTDQPRGGRNRRGGMGVTLYSARHQFVANAKAHGLSKVEIAALVGHGSIHTAASHYGKRRFGHPGSTFWATPIPENIEAVVQKNNLHVLASENNEKPR